MFEEIKKFGEYITREWRVVKSAPAVFVTLVLLASMLTFWASQTLHKGRISVLEEEVKSRDAWIGEYREKLHASSPNEAASRMAALEHELNDARSQISELQKRFASREIKGEAGLINALSAAEKYPIEVTYEIGDAETLQYAKNLMRILKAAGWEVVQDYMGSDLPQGLSIASLDSQQGAKALASILRQHNLEVGENDLIVYRAGALALGVGRKP